MRRPSLSSTRQVIALMAGGSMAELLGGTRRALWHLRAGGLAQLRAHRLRRSAGGGPGQAPVRVGRSSRGTTVHVDPWPVPAVVPVRDVRVGVILDDFSRLALAPEWEQVLLDPSTGVRVLDDEPIDLLFVESAWNGNGGAWQYHLTGPTAPRPALVDLVEACRARGIPTVFWNKEDPVHFEDFLDTARLFDRVCTTDGDMIPGYRAALGHDRVELLPFAAQPTIHNPVRSHGHGPQRDVAFGGTYFAHKYPERREQMDVLLGGALDASAHMEHGLEIFSRFAGRDERYQFPPPLDERVVGSLDYEQMLTAYREYKVFLNVNSIVGSPTMCARRVLEISACGTPVVTTPSPAISALFEPDEVFVVHDREEAAHTVRALVGSAELRDRATHRARRRIWREHTYGARVQRVLHDVGLATTSTLPRPRVTALVSTCRPHRLDDVVATVAAQRDVDVQLAVLAHGFEVDADELRRSAKEAGIDDVLVLHADADVPLGECLNRLVRAADGDVVAKMDDDDLYGPYYLSDQLDALAYSGADVVGKQARYVYVERQDVTLLRSADREHRFTDLVAGPTIVARRDLVGDRPFAALRTGEDTAFLRGVVADGGTVFSADRFGFAQVRSADGGHTWDVDDAALLAEGRVVHLGPPVAQVAL
ncbi:glycosyltransferase family protein [Sediminihabitans luteus]|uniref:glycosyltransferase family protein n=1 Tax=Sediminihabitans luteus TaxID=1138585 RepID=UPI0027E42016|nr:glycosyltransferase [Sediminihabitans luteus]